MHALSLRNTLQIRSKIIFMIGNDVIDLRCAQNESNWKRKGFVNKIYTIPEQQIISSASNPDLLVWILWSMKEASYKANNRITAVKEYAPTKINCKIDQVENNIYFGTATYNKLEYQLKTFVFSDYIHTIALYNSGDFSNVKEITIRNYPSNYIEYLKKNNHLMFYENIKKDKFGIPNMHNDFKNDFRPMSISHHGLFLCLVIK